MKEVLIHIRGGVAEIVFKSHGVVVTLVDWDNTSDNHGEPTIEVSDQDEICSQ